MNPSVETRTDMLPLREPTFFILLSLVPGKKHGYAILKDVEELSRGKVMLSTGTLYEALARLLVQEIIERIADEENGMGRDLDEMNHRGKVRKAYCLTKAGRSLIEAEIQRMHSLILIAKTQLQLAEQEHGWRSPSIIG